MEMNRYQVTGTEDMIVYPYISDWDRMQFKLVLMKGKTGEWSEIDPSLGAAGQIVWLTKNGGNGRPSSTLSADHTGNERGTSGKTLRLALHRQGWKRAMAISAGSGSTPEPAVRAHLKAGRYYAVCIGL